MDRIDHSGIKNAVIILLLLVLMGAGYVIFRRVQNPSIAALARISKIGALPSTICTISSGSFQGSTTGKVYISRGKMRVDGRVVVNGGAERLVHIISSDENGGTLYTWFDGDTNGVTGTNTYAQGPFSVANVTGCSPWWFPNSATFQIPDTVTFSSAQ